MARNNKKYLFIPRWEIQVLFTTSSLLHIGCDEAREITITKEDDTEKKAEVNAFIKDSNKKPYIPGSTIKGNFRNWLKRNIKETPDVAALYKSLLGSPVVNDDQGCGGSAEFHNATISRRLGETSNFPYWEEELQTSVETSTVINRVTGTVADQKLYYTEVVPPGVGFTMIITGTMTEDELALLVAALDSGFVEDCADPITFGAGSGNGFGRFSLESIGIKRLGRTEVVQWLEGGSLNMAGAAMQPLSQDDTKQYINTGKNSLKTPSVSAQISLDFAFAGPFLVNDPARDKDHPKPLQDTQGHARLPAKSFRGALRSQAEKIIRTLGGRCCDPENPCTPIFSADEVDEQLCLACRIFGATGWKSRLSIKSVKYKGTVEPTEPEPKQDFVAIDRFHGGGKDSAKFDAAFSYQPKYTITMQANAGLADWAKGLLALLFRDFKEGDIFLGYGRSKGYGCIDPASVRFKGVDSWHTQANLDAFRLQCQDNEQVYPCASRQPPEPEVSASTEQQATAEEPALQHPFHNPYHFIPTPEPRLDSWLQREDFNEKMHDSHAVYRDTDDNGNTLYHGRVTCSLTTESPIFVGGKHRDRTNDTTAQKIDHYAENGEIAIPATTLRGVISSLAEAASNSSMRVLDNGIMSYRQDVGSESLSAIGMVVMRENKKYIYPLALPVFRGDEPLSGEYGAMFPKDKHAPFKVYLEKAYMTGEMKNFLDGQKSWSLQNNTIFYLPVPEFSFDSNHRLIDGNSSRNCLKFSNGGNQVLGIRLPGNPCPRTGENKLPGDVPGIIRILGKDGRGDAVPGTKKHELFIPVPDAFADNPREFINNVPIDALFEIPDEVVKHFEELADDRTTPQIKHPAGIGETQWLPYHLKGTARNNGLTGAEARKLRIKGGDLIYFRPYKFSPRQVNEISFSSVWRARVTKTVHNYFPAELLPFDEERKAISPAELLFGFVQQDKNKTSQAFAGKTVISSARSKAGADPTVMDEITLKILASPKLPSPSLYFKGEGYIAKKDMNSTMPIQPRGRKHYLHALPDPSDPEGVQKISRTGQSNGDEYPWVSRNTDNLKQKVRIQPVRKGNSFTFSLEFDNCTEWEVGMLLYALRPTEEYRHKIGMGKPIGLGTVRLDIKGIEFINRSNRYGSDKFDTQRYNHNAPPAENSFREIFAATIHPEIKKSIELLGNPQNVQYPVHYPQVQGADLEEKSYQWFVANDKGTNNGLNGHAHRKKVAQKSSLKELNETSNTIPGMERHEWLGK